MKENNKFSLKAFFCSLGSISKRSKFVLLGAPFFLAYFLSLKVYANSAVVPVVPEGLTSSGIGSSGVVPGDPSLMYYTLLIALGMKADEVYQINKADIIDSVTEALNDFDSVNDPTLGDDLETYLEWYDNAKSQNGYINELSIPRELWDRLNKATSSGMTVKTVNHSGVTSYSDFISYVNSLYDITTNNFQESMFSTPVLQYTNDRGYPVWVFGYSSYEVNGSTLILHFDYSGYYVTAYVPYYNPSLLDYGYSSNLEKYNVSNVTQISAGGTVNKHVGIARPFISSKANETYDLVSKSATFDHEGKIGGDVTISVLSYDEIQTLANDDPDTTTDIPPVLPRMRVVPIDIDDPDAIPDSPGIPGETPQEIAEELADTVDPSPVDPIVIEPFLHIDQWDPYVPDPSPEPPLVGLSAVMNWLALQMQTTMYLTQFSNTWLVLSTLVVAACMIGLVRIWR